MPFFSFSYLFKFFSSAPCEGFSCGLHATCKPDGEEAMCVCNQGWSYDPMDISAGCKGNVLFILKNCMFEILTRKIK